MLIFTPLSIVKSSGKPEQTTERAREKLDTVHIVTLRVENRNNISEKLPEFALTAWSDTAIYDAKRLGQLAPRPEAGRSGSAPLCRRDGSEPAAYDAAGADAGDVPALRCVRSGSGGHVPGRTHSDCRAKAGGGLCAADRL